MLILHRHFVAQACKKELSSVSRPASDWFCDWKLQILIYSVKDCFFYGLYELLVTNQKIVQSKAAGYKLFLIVLHLLHQYTTMNETLPQLVKAWIHIFCK
jgi:hypothetical protein